MATLIALLRGINVGHAKRVSMADLREAVESLGFTDVRTLLNSGNVVFKGKKAADIAARIEEAVLKKTGVSSRVTILTADELAAAIVENPHKHVAIEPSRYLVAVPAKPADLKRLGALARTEWKPEAFAIGSRVAFMWCPLGSLESALAAALGKALGSDVTVRNWATMLKLHAIAQGTSD